jgi:hypothetical protein
MIRKTIQNILELTGKRTVKEYFTVNKALHIAIVVRSIANEENF